jgi:hypothetical protein
MILNAYAVLDAFMSGLRLLLGFMVVWLAVSALRGWSRSLAVERKTDLEDRSYGLFLLAAVLLVLNIASWPLFYLLLQSYVPEWRGVMCIYGVTRIGTGSLGPSRFLPGLVTALQVLKPAMVFATGGWLVLYLLNRGTRTAPLMWRVLLAVMVLGLLAIVDAAAESAYLVIPKKEVFASAGCCSVAFDVSSRSSGLVSEALLGADYGPRLHRLYYGVNLGMCLALAATLFLPRWRQSRAWLAVLGFGAVASLAVNLLFLIELAAPAILHLPDHHCPYDLFPDWPASVIAAGLFIVGCFGVGWACIAGWFGRCAETAPFLGSQIARMLRLALAGYTISLVMFSVELARA